MLKRDNLSGAILVDAMLVDATLKGAVMVDSILDSADLKRAILKSARLTRANLNQAKMEEADLVTADLVEAQLHGTCLRRAKLSGALLTGADLIHADLGDAELGNANLERAILFHVARLPLNNTFIRDAQFDARAKDQWSQLRRRYTGPRMLFTLLFLVAFFIPYIVKTAGWVVANQVQVHVDSAAVRLGALALEAEASERQTAAVLRSISNALASRVPGKGAPGWREWRVGYLVLGFGREWTYWATALALLVFNVLRGWLTFVVAPMRDAEERSGWSPALTPRVKGWKGLLKDPGSLLEAYGWLWWPHLAVRTLFWVSVGSFAYHAWHWLTLPVWVPV